MTDENGDFEKVGKAFESVLSRILKPETDADRELMWTAIGFFLFGAIVV